MAIKNLDENTLAELGARLARHRLNKNMTQEDLAALAGISVATLKRIESGSHSTLFINIVKILRALGIQPSFDLIVPDVPPSPIQIANLQKRYRQRAKKKTKPAADEDTPTWTWSQ